MRVVFFGRLAREAIEPRLQQVSGVDLVVVDRIPELIAALGGADALITPDCLEDEAEQIMAALRGPGKTVRWIQFVSAGQEGLTAAGILALPSGIVITQQGGAVGPAVAEHAMAMFLGLARRIPEISIDTGQRVWDPTIGRKTTALEGRILAVIGLGNVGRQLARRARAFDMKILGVTRRPGSGEFADEVHPLAGLRHVLGRADAIAVTIALTDETYHLIGEEEFAVCKPNAFFVNVARGGVVDNSALCRALNEGKIAGAGLDVTEPEPLPPEDPLWDCPNVIISPHIGGGGSPKSRVRLVGTIADNLERFVAGKPLTNVLER